MKKIILLLFLSCNIYAASRGELIEQIRYGIKDTTNTVVITSRWPENVLNTWINTVQRGIARETRCLYREYFTTATAEVAEYTLPDDCFKIDCIAVLWQSSTSATNQYRKLPRFTRAGLYRDNPAWQSIPSGIPLKYYEERNKVGFVPKFSATYCSTGCIQIDYYALPQDMTSDSDIPWNSDPSLEDYNDLIADGVIIMCLKAEGNASWTTLEQIFQSNILQMKNNLLYQPDGSGGMAVDFGGK